MSSSRDIPAFTRTILSYWKEHGRHTLPWRATRDPYQIMVSEFMLQQTQVSRVIPKFSAFIERFPSVKILAKAPLSEVLKMWSGLGYNRRAKYLHDAAKHIQSELRGKFPTTYDALVALPGIGDYTAKAILVFGYESPEALIETNVRAACIHHFFPRASRVPDSKLYPLVAEALEEAMRNHSSREWYAALMDYGSHLKETQPNPSRRSKHHVKQSKFEGSLREVRGAIVRTLGFSSTNEESLQAELEFPRERFLEALEGLFKDGLIEEKNGILRLSMS